MRAGDLRDAQDIEEVGEEGRAEVAGAAGVRVGPERALGEVIARGAEEEEAAGHHDVDRAVDRAAR